MSEPIKLPSPKTPPPPPPPFPGLTWHSEAADPMDIWFPRLMLGVIGVMLLAMVTLFLAIGLPQLLIAGHAAWSQALAVWGLR